MSKQERELITDLRKCNFNELAEYFKAKSEERKNMSKEEKQVSRLTLIIVSSVGWANSITNQTLSLCVSVC